MYASLPVSTFYLFSLNFTCLHILVPFIVIANVIITLFDDVFRFAIIVEQFELSLMELIFTISILISCSWSASFSILWTALLLELLHTSLKWFIL